MPQEHESFPNSFWRKHRGGGPERAGGNAPFLTSGPLQPRSISNPACPSIIPCSRNEERSGKARLAAQRACVLTDPQPGATAAAYPQHARFHGQTVARQVHFQQCRSCCDPATRPGHRQKAITTRNNVPDEAHAHIRAFDLGRRAVKSADQHATEGRATRFDLELAKIAVVNGLGLSDTLDRTGHGRGCEQREARGKKNGFNASSSFGMRENPFAIVPGSASRYGKSK